MHDVISITAFYARASFQDTQALHNESHIIRIYADPDPSGFGNLTGLDRYALRAIMPFAVSEGYT